MKKIILVVESFGAGVFGVVRFVANELAAAGNEVYVVHDIRPDTPPDYFSQFDERVELVYFPLRRMAKVVFSFNEIRKFCAFIKSVGPDVVHLHSSFAGAVGRLVKPFLAIRSRWYYSPHAFKFASGGFSSCIFWILEWLLSFSNVTLVACSSGELSQARYFWSKSILLENSVPNLSDFLVENEFDDLLIVSMGRMVAQKRPDRFIEICENSGIDPNCFLWIGAGDEVYENKFREKGIKFTGWIDAQAARNLLSKCTIYIQCSAYEGMPLSVIEAQLYGKPCLVSNVVGNRDVILDGVTGFVCDDIFDFVGRIEFLKKNLTALKQMSQAAKQLSFERFNPKSYIARISSIYGIDL